MKLAAIVATLVTLGGLAPLATADKSGTTPIDARVVKVEVVGKDTLATVSAGSSQGVDKELACSFIAAKSSTPLVGKCDIVRIDKTTTLIKTDLPRDQVMHATVKIGPIVR